MKAMEKGQRGEKTQRTAKREKKPAAAKQEKHVPRPSVRDMGRSPAPEREDVLGGRNAVLEALKAGRGINRILTVPGGREKDMAPLLSLAAERGVPVRPASRQKLDEIAPGLRLQGVLAYVAPVAYASLEDILARAEAQGEPPLLLLVDGIEDPHNVGALLRTADAAGVHGVLLPERRSCAFISVMGRSSCLNFSAPSERLSAHGDGRQDFGRRCRICACCPHRQYRAGDEAIEGAGALARRR